VVGGLKLSNGEITLGSKGVRFQPPCFQTRTCILARFTYVCACVYLCVLF